MFVFSVVVERAGMLDGLKAAADSYLVRATF
jgi:hypothetical protein